MIKDNRVENIDFQGNKMKELIGSLGLWEIRILYYFWMGNSSRSPQAILNFYNIKTDSRTSVRRGLKALEERGLLEKE